LRNNLDEKNADRVAKSLHKTQEIINNLEVHFSAKHNTSSGGKPNFTPDVKKLAVELTKAKLFIEQDTHRQYESFPEFNQDINHDKLFTWMKQKSLEFQDLYKEN